jgi:hypothetical protein
VSLFDKFQTPRAQAALKKVLHDLVDDTTINTVVTYKQHLGRSTTFDPESQSLDARSENIFH